MARTNCVYCNKEITTRSREHVIQNALGGLYESDDICCPECNNYISRHIDVPFTTIFNPILGNIENLGKTNNKNSTPIYTGTVSYQGNQYAASFKGGKITSCPELSRALRCDISKLPLEVLSYNFDLKNDSFQTGMAKIAFNYALDRGVDLEVIKHGLKVSRNGADISKIEYDYPIIPFCPMNVVDMYLEIGTPTELYHNMILFSQHNRLWCYIDLFNTFQYYVLLSDKLPCNTQIYDSYMQTLQKPDRTEPKVEIFRPKDAMIYAVQYGVEPCMDQQEMQRRINNVIAKKSQKQSMQKVIGRKIECLSVYDIMQNINASSQIMQFGCAMSLYLNEDDILRQDTFRIVTPDSNGGQVIPYPDAILSAFHNDKSALATYTTAKFNKLNSFLIKTK